MKRILLDENVPFGLIRLLKDHEVLHITELGWDGISNGRLLAAAEREGFSSPDRVIAALGQAEPGRSIQLDLG